ncbi:MAG: hypothetical protein BWY59_00146 [Verrucomicrobia bacterium ADurb.Bin345]|nr:MAG: hypothetical protein BWY59_00146 [Verrucomicrobia bacterium ADurb.Bin345]
MLVVFGLATGTIAGGNPTLIWSGTLLLGDTGSLPRTISAPERALPLVSPAALSTTTIFVDRPATSVPLVGVTTNQARSFVGTTARRSMVQFRLPPPEFATCRTCVAAPPTRTHVRPMFVGTMLMTA